MKAGRGTGIRSIRLHHLVVSVTCRLAGQGDRRRRATLRSADISTNSSETSDAGPRKRPAGAAIRPWNIRSDASLFDAVLRPIHLAGQPAAMVL